MTSQAKPRPARGGGGNIKEFSVFCSVGPDETGPEQKAPLYILIYNSTYKIISQVTILSYIMSSAIEEISLNKHMSIISIIILTFNS